ncbi:hypothetical protein ACFSY7_17115 [Kurthia populi]|uniref:Uncharacterized protein n=1 Tax=Kurthia populi TaxID=1562132 RepID=A0ABW5Y576_9BACL
MFKTNRTVESMSYKQKALLVAGIFLCMELGLMVSMEFSIALPSIITDIGGAEFYALIFTVNLAVSAIVTPFVGKLSSIQIYFYISLFLIKPHIESFLC